MLIHINQKRGQSTLEYAVLIIVIIAALISIQAYIKRGVQGRLKSASDDIGDQFSPGNTNSIIAEKVHSSTIQEFGVKANPDGTVVAAQGAARTIILNESTNSMSNSSIVNEQKENWGG
jgi:hypothetical protein